MSAPPDLLFQAAEGIVHAVGAVSLVPESQEPVESVVSGVRIGRRIGVRGLVLHVEHSGPSLGDQDAQHHRCPGPEHRPHYHIAREVGEHIDPGECYERRDGIRYVSYASVVEREHGCGRERHQRVARREGESSRHALRRQVDVHPRTGPGCDVLQEPQQEQVGYEHHGEQDYAELASLPRQAQRRAQVEP